MDILALCTGMRPVIMVDYGGKMPELQERLCAFLKHCKKESSVFELLRVMVIEDMIYLIQVRELADFVKSSLNLEIETLFVDLEKDPPKMTTQMEKHSAAMQLLSAQKLFGFVFPADGLNSDPLQSHGIDLTANAGPSLSELVTSGSTELIDLSCCLQTTQVTVPTLNGWLLCYPVVYLFGKEHIDRAIYNLSTKSLHIFQIFICRDGASSKGSRQELMSFTVPFDLSSEGNNEPWAKAFLARIQGRWERCKHVWGSLQMEVSGCYPQAIVL
ncbi:hypothetical protein Fot_30914 [Forsythia ovata]|uniref:Uncharacterized protein n=1 Tax=Forsythia ovata TaxID=205694 RepID=A0ABD1T3G4_9LAMI